MNSHPKSFPLGMTYIIMSEASVKSKLKDQLSNLSKQKNMEQKYMVDNECIYVFELQYLW